VTDDAVFAAGDHLDGVAGRVGVGFTRRSLDLGDRAPAAVRRAALAEVARETGAQPLTMRQVHGAGVQVVEEWRSTTREPRVDALVTAVPGVALLARAADCVPVLLADADAGVVAAVHAGRVGVALGVVVGAVTRMRELGAQSVTAWVGPHICGGCYEVPESMQEEVAAMVPVARAVTTWGTPSLDLGAGVRAQLAAAGITTVQVVPGCTREDPAWPSHRRDGDGATRFAAVVWRT
jgi:YfiH family protein